MLDLSKVSLTTVQGILSAAGFAALSLVPVFPGHAAWLSTAAGVLGVLKAAVGYYQQDAGKQLAVPPSGGEPVVMPSHETPDEPGAKAVAK